MAPIPEEVMRQIEDFVNKVKKQIPVKKAILFGSYATGTFEHDSDVDLAIFSVYFESVVDEIVKTGIEV